MRCLLPPPRAPPLPWHALHLDPWHTTDAICLEASALPTPGGAAPRQAAATAGGVKA